MSESLANQINRLADDAPLTPLSEARRPLADRMSPIILSVVRNEKRRLADFLGHYRRLGTQTFAVVDNASTDGTREFLKGQPDVYLFAADQPFDAVRKHAWITQLVRHFGDRWYLLADADEHAVFSGVRKLTDLAQVAERFGRGRVRGALIDMYPEGPLADVRRPEGQPLLEAFPFFDPSGYDESQEVALTTRVGGPRRRVLGAFDREFAPQLTKYPFFRLKEKETVVSPHYIHPPTPGPDPCWIGLLHFKFDEDAKDRIRDAVERGQYWRESYEYRVYDNALKTVPDLSFHHPRSARWKDAADLVRLGLIDEVPRSWSVLPLLQYFRRPSTAWGSHTRRT